MRHMAVSIYGKNIFKVYNTTYVDKFQCDSISISNFNSLGNLKNIKALFQFFPHSIQHFGYHTRHSACDFNVALMR